MTMNTKPVMLEHVLQTTSFAMLVPPCHEAEMNIVHESYPPEDSKFCRTGTGGIRHVVHTFSLAIMALAVFFFYIPVAD